MCIETAICTLCGEAGVLLHHLKKLDTLASLSTPPTWRHIHHILRPLLLAVSLRPKLPAVSGELRTTQHPSIMKQPNLNFSTRSESSLISNLNSNSNSAPRPVDEKLSPSDSAAANKQPETKCIRTVTIQQTSKRSPDRLLTFDVSVLDTFPEDAEQTRRTVVAIHGFPGAGVDFEPLAVKLREKGIRLVATTSLGMAGSPISMSQMQEIDFSTEGRLQTIDLVLKEIKIHRIDMLLGYSGGAWSVYKAGASWDNVASIFVINPGGARPNRTLRPFCFLKLIAAALKWKLGRFLISPFLAYSYRLIGFRDVTKSGSGVNLVVAQQYITQQGFKHVPINAGLVRQRQIPTVFAYALNDKIVESPICSEMAYNLLGIPANNMVTYTDDKTPSQDPFFVPEGWLSRCLVFARGGHIVHIAHQKEILEQIENMLEYVQNSSKKKNNTS